jgi:hypothetical protein
MERALIAAGVLERDDTNDVLGVWSYPGVEPATEQVAIARSCLETVEGSAAKLTVSQFGGKWLYQCTQAAGEAKQLSKVTHFSVWTLAKDFHPELFLELTKVFADAYAQEGNPVSILQIFLSVFARGQGPGINTESFNIQHSLLAGPIKESITTFGDTFILLWVAMLLKKRIVVYCDEEEKLLQFLRCLPLLVWHRRDFDLLFPVVQLQEDQLDDLAAHGVYCAGFTDDAIKVRSDLYDVLVDIPGQSLSVNEKAKADLGMGDFHRGIGKFLSSMAASEEASTADVVKGITKKTTQLFSKLTVLKDAQQLNLDALEAQEGVSRSFARFLFNVAVSENMC